ncbi:MAG: YlxM family DNA-binding protein [Lachnospiraceae bacterium]
MDKLLEKALLYDFYGELLTKQQKNVYEAYVLEDMSESEIAREQGITRQGVHDMMKRCNRKLEEYEEKLQLVSKFVKTKDRVEQIHQYACQISEGAHENQIAHHIEQIEDLSNAILEEF